jgi:hypothetical protein
MQEGALAQFYDLFLPLIPYGNADTRIMLPPWNI